MAFDVIPDVIKKIDPIDINHLQRSHVKFFFVIFGFAEVNRKIMSLVFRHTLDKTMKYKKLSIILINVCHRSICYSFPKLLSKEIIKRLIPRTNMLYLSSVLNNNFYLL